MTDAQMFYAQAASIAVAFGMVVVALRWPNAGRLLFALLFAWAGQLNLRLALTHPGVYLDYALVAWSDAYRSFILGPFSHHVRAVVIPIAAAQLAIALLVSPGAAVRLGLAGAIVFLVAIAPLGRGSAFPATPIMAVAAALLLRMRHGRSLWSLRPWVSAASR